MIQHYNFLKKKKKYTKNSQAGIKKWRFWIQKEFKSMELLKMTF